MEWNSLLRGTQHTDYLSGDERERERGGEDEVGVRDGRGNM